MLLKPNMVISGKECAKQATVEEVALATMRCLRRHVPAACRESSSFPSKQARLAATGI